jgi:hypothetical protein
VPSSTVGEDAIGRLDLKFHFSCPVAWSSAYRCPLRLAIYTTPPATAGDVTIGPAALKVHFRDGACTGPAPA